MLTRSGETTAKEGDAATRVFMVTAGRVYELRAGLRRFEGLETSLSLTSLDVDFFDRAGRRVDPGIVGPDLQIPHLHPLRLETLPPSAQGEIAFDAGLASRFLVAPPDAVEVRVTLATSAVEIFHLDLAPLAVSWTTSGKRFADECRRLLEARLAFLAQIVPPSKGASDKEARELASIAPLEQIESLREQFATRGDWSNAIKVCDAAAETSRLETRLARLRGNRAQALRIGFIGSARTYNRLRAHADVFLLREDTWQAQLDALALDTVHIETVAASWPGDWHLAFCGPDGLLPSKGRALCQAASARSIPVRAHVTVGEGEIGVWRGFIGAADTVVIEDERSGWTAPPERAFFIRRGVEPAVTPPLWRGRREATMLVPVASDIAEFQDFAAVVHDGACYSLLISEFDREISGKAVADRPTIPDTALCVHSQAQRTRLLQESTIVLLSGATRCGTAQMAAILIDAISCGAVPVIYGAGAEELELEVDRVWSGEELQELQRLYRVPGLRQRRWRTLWRAVLCRHMWRSEDRAKLFGLDPEAADFDEPCMTAVAVSDGSTNLAACLEKFRGQTWPEKELVIILKTGEAPPLPDLRDNESVHIVPSTWSSALCLELAALRAKGSYTAELSDAVDCHHLEDLCALHRSNQADWAGWEDEALSFQHLLPSKASPCGDADGPHPETGRSQSGARARARGVTFEQEPV